ncbi:LysR family transcriptional regulator [Sinomonas albida]|uniref:LysR family transcriptional regulator n=1 Tax=Sinomonas albida TaxID=369942 RepID=UPI0010A831C7|nr:LysR family transcriptional regulator [Sinomonas albida]
MELRVLEYFLAVAESGTVSAAAQACFVTQPAISRQLAGLEQELGVRLFQRRTSGMRLTAAGERFRPIAQDVVWRASTGTGVMKSLQSGRLDLVLACPPTVMRYIVAPFLAETGAPLRDVSEHAPDRVYRELELRRADLAIGTARPPQQYAAQKVFTAPLSVQSAPGYSSLPQMVDLADLQGHPLLLAATGSAIRHVIDDAAAEAGLALDVSAEVSSSNVAQALAAAGRGLAVAAEPPQFGLEMRALTHRGRPLSIIDWAAWDPDHYAAPEIEALAHHLSDWARLNLRYGAQAKAQ